jgi:hypothetical protein
MSSTYESYQTIKGEVKAMGGIDSTGMANDRAFTFTVRKSANPGLVKVFTKPDLYDFKLRFTDNKFTKVTPGMPSFNSDQINVMTQTNTRESGFTKNDIVKEDKDFIYFKGWFGIRDGTTLPRGTQFTVHWTERKPDQLPDKIIGTLDSNTRNPFTFKVKKSDNPKLSAVFSDPKKYNWKLNFTDKRFFDGTFDAKDYKIANLLRQSSDGFNPDSLKSQDSNFYYFDSWFGINADIPKGTEFTISFK